MRVELEEMQTYILDIILPIINILDFLCNLIICFNLQNVRQQESPHFEEICVDAWVKQTLDFHTTSIYISF